MIFSSKAEYGVRLMVELGRQSPEQPTSLKAIADAEGLPLAYLEQVVARLRKAGLVMSARGAHGGYWLRAAGGGDRDGGRGAGARGRDRPDGVLRPRPHRARAVLARARRRRRRCATKLLWTRVQGGIIRSLQTTTLAELVEFSRATEHVATSARVPGPLRTPARARVPRKRTSTSDTSPGSDARSRDPKPSCPRRREGDPPRARPGRRQGRDPRADGPERIGQVDARQRDHGAPQPRGDRGQILFKGQDITEADPDERARLGLFMAFQYPVAVPGVTVTKYLRTVLNAHREARGRGADPAQGVSSDGGGGDGAHERAEEFSAPLSERGLLRRREEAAWRYCSWRCSGRELAILDETDSGLDIDALRVVANGVNSVRRARTWAC